MGILPSARLAALTCLPSPFACELQMVMQGLPLPSALWAFLLTQSLVSRCSAPSHFGVLLRLPALCFLLKGPVTPLPPCLSPSPWGSAAPALV